MATLREWFKAFESRHGAIHTVRVGLMDAWYDDDPAGEEYLERTGWPLPPPHPCTIENVPDEVLDHEFKSGYGRTEVPPVFAWSKSHVFMISQYDGSTRWFAVPRFPRKDEPFMPGGG